LRSLASRSFCVVWATQQLVSAMTGNAYSTLDQKRNLILKYVVGGVVLVVNEERY